MNDAALVEELARLSCRESHACGINWMFAPCCTVPDDLRWGRTYEAFSEDPAVVAELAAAEVRGIQTCGVPMAACVKHWVADGATALGTGTKDFEWTGAPVGVLDQGDAQIDERELRERHVAAYLPALAASGAAAPLTVMVSYSSWNGVKAHASHYLVTTLLKEELGFGGLVVSDFNGVQQCCPDDFKAALALALNAGIDMVMTAGGMYGDVPLADQLEVAERAVGEGLVPMARIDDAVRRICASRRRCASSTTRAAAARPRRLRRLRGAPRRHAPPSASRSCCCATSAAFCRCAPPRAPGGRARRTTSGCSAAAGRWSGSASVATRRPRAPRSTTACAPRAQAPSSSRRARRRRRRRRARRPRRRRRGAVRRGGRRHPRPHARRRRRRTHRRAARPGGRAEARLRAPLRPPARAAAAAPREARRARCRLAPRYRGRRRRGRPLRRRAVRGPPLIFVAARQCSGTARRARTTRCTGGGLGCDPCAL